MAHVVWFKRDLRIRDHRPLVTAAARGTIVALYVYEPDLIEAAETSSAQRIFIDECLAELETELAARGVPFTYRHGTMPDVLQALASEIGSISALYSHEETGDARSYARDRRVADWCNAHGVPWQQFPQFGVIRALRSRDGWARAWDRRMSEPIVAVPERVSAVVLTSERRRTLRELGLPPTPQTDVQRGGSSLAWAELESFLAERGVGYRADMASPVTARNGCSRLSPYLAYGAISMRDVFSRARQREREIADARAAGEQIDPRWAGALASFRGRLHWHCHFMQKLEDQPSLEFVNAARAYDGLREADFDEDRFAAWCAGQTGYPMVDACMRALHATGWINFRMRAMLMSFASYHLWLHWRRTGTFLANLFLDFEPAIHWPQSQMQSGVTGINTVRIYSPAKQARDNDPNGLFIRRYVPELARVPDAWLAEPHTLPPLIAAEARFRIGVDYPLPIVDSTTATRYAKERIYAIRRLDESRVEARHIYTKHGSRKPSRQGPRSSS